MISLKLATNVILAIIFSAFIGAAMLDLWRYLNPVATREVTSRPMDSLSGVGGVVTVEQAVGEDFYHLQVDDRRYFSGNLIEYIKFYPLIDPQIVLLAVGDGGSCCQPKMYFVDVGHKPAYVSGSLGWIGEPKISFDPNLERFVITGFDGTEQTTGTPRKITFIYDRAKSKVQRSTK